MRQKLIFWFLGFSTLSFIFTEVLSFFNILYPLPLLLLWTATLVGAAYYLKKQPLPRPNVRLQKDFTTIYAAAFLVLIMLPLLFLALYIPPNNVDSLGYHLTRIENWIYNHNVNYYPTSDLRELYHQPLAEYLILQMRLLTNSDLFSNSIQFLAYVLVIVLGTLLAQSFGADKKQQFFTAGCVAVLPMAIMEATTTQTDLIAGVYFLSFLYYFLIYLKTLKTADLTVSALSLLLGFVTKASILVFAAPFLPWLFWHYLQQKPGLQTIGRHAAITLFLALILTGPYFVRNIQATGKIMGDPYITHIMKNEHIDHRVVASNFVRNIADQFTLPWLDGYNQLLSKMVIASHRCIGIAYDDQRTSFMSMYSPNLDFRFHEDRTGNILHILLFVLAGALLPAWSKKIKNKRTKNTLQAWYVLSILSYLVFCAVFRWQPWGMRLQLPLLLLMSVITSCILYPFIAKPKTLHCILILLLLSALPFVYFNKAKAFIPVYGGEPIYYRDRNENYFNNVRTHKADYKAAIQKVQASSEHVVSPELVGGNGYLLWRLVTRKIQVSGIR